MSFRLLKVSHYYSEYIQKIEKNYENFTQGYQEGLDELLNKSFAWSNFYQLALQNLGYEVVEYVQNAPWLNKSYSQAFGILNNSLEIIRHQIKVFKPDILFFDTVSLPPGFISSLKNENSFLKKIVLFNCSPATQQIYSLMRECDFVVTCHRGLHQDYSEMGLKNYHIYHSFGKEVLTRVAPNYSKDPRILFSGSIYPGQLFHDERLEYLKKFLNSEIPTDFLIQIPSPIKFSEVLREIVLSTVDLIKFKKTIKSAVSDINKIILQCSHRNSTVLNEIRRKTRQPVFGLDMYKSLAKSLVTFNIHGGIARNYMANMRIFEATGMGSCLLTDSKDDLSELFIPDKEIVTYSNTNECIEKANWLISHPNKALEIAQAGQLRTLSDHTFDNRAKQLDQIFKKEIP